MKYRKHSFLRKPQPLRIGYQLTFHHNGEWLTGEIWGQAPGKNNYWLAANGHFFKVKRVLRHGKNYSRSV